MAAPSTATTAPSPPEEPPEVCAVDHGLHVRPQSGFALSKANIVCGTFVLAMMMAPASRSVATTYRRTDDRKVRRVRLKVRNGK
jgi:hypothetical protein